MQGKAVRVSSSPLLGHRRGVQTKRVSRKRGVATAAPSVCAPAFLTTPIDVIRLADNNVASRFGINIEKSYRRVLACCKRFLKFVGVSFDFAPTNGLSRSQELGELIDYFEKKIEPMGLSLCVSKKTAQGDEQGILECIVYRFGRELEERIVIFYASPAKYLSPHTSALYKRFMKFLSDNTNIPLGYSTHGENLYLDMIISCWEDDYDLYGEDDEEEVEPRTDSTAKKYMEGGEFWNLFDEIDGLPKEPAEMLLADLEDCLKDCPAEEADVVKVMIEGVPIVKDANCYWFEFNPEDDGLPDAYGRDDYDEWASSVFASAILYSEHDGVEKKLLDSINEEINAGTCMSGWNIHQWLSPTTKKEDIDDFMRCKDLVADLDTWVYDFYQETRKFDKYEQSEQCAE